MADLNAQVTLYLYKDIWSLSLWIWKLIPVKIDGRSEPSQTSSETLGPGSLPTYDGNATAEQPSTCAAHVESEHDEFGTIVKEVTVVTTTTYKKYRVEDA